MKKLIFILLAIFNQNIFCAQVQEEVKSPSEHEKIEKLKKLFSDSALDYERDQNKLKIENGKIKNFIITNDIDLNINLDKYASTLYRHVSTPLMNCGNLTIK